MGGARGGFGSQGGTARPLAPTLTGHHEFSRVKCYYNRSYRGFHPGPWSRPRLPGTLARPRTPPPGSAEPARSAPGGTWRPRGAPTLSAPRTSSQGEGREDNCPKPPNLHPGDGSPPLSTPTRLDLLRTCSAGRSRGGKDRGLSRAPRAPGAAGRICSGHAGQTRRQLQPLRLRNLQHRQSLPGTGFAPWAGGGLGAGPPERPRPAPGGA